MTMPSLILGIAPLVDRGRPALAGSRPLADPLELRPRAVEAVGADRAARCLKALAFAALALILLEPLLTGSRPRRGANAFVGPGRQQPEPADPRRRRPAIPRRLGARPAPPGVRLEDAAGAGFRRPQLCLRLPPPRRRWLRRPDLRRHRLRRWRPRSRRSSKRFRGLPLAGVLAVHRRQPDGRRATSTGRRCRRSIPSSPRRGGSPATSACARSRSARPTSSRPRSSSGPTSRPSASRASRSSPPSIDEAGKEVERQEAKPTGDGKPLSFRFQFRPETQGRELLHASAPSRPRRRRRTEGRHGAVAARASRRSPTTAGSSSSTRGAGPTGCST